MTKYKKLSSYLIIFLAVIFAVCPAFLSPKPSANLHASGEITDLTGTKWQLNSTISWVESSYNIDIEYDEYEFEKLIMSSSIGPRSLYLYSLYFDVYMIAENTNTTTLSTHDDIFTITGGTDATNSTLISWLQGNATRIVTPEPTPSTGVIANIFVSTAMVSLFALLIVFAVVKNKKHAL